MASSATLLPRNLQSAPGTMNQNYTMNGKIIVSTLAILFFIVFIIILLHIYAKYWLRRSSNTISRLHHSLSFQGTSLISTGGLDREIVEALPTFTYKPPCLSKASEAAEAAKCVVCLSAFRPDETCKLLPKCKHFFHIDCIGMWFLSNTTCPLCRTAADPNSDCGEAHGSMPCCFAKQEGPGHELGEHQYHQRPVVATSGTRNDTACDYSNDTLLRGHFSLQSPTTSRNYRRSKSEKFSPGTRGMSLAPNNVFGGNGHTHMTTRLNHTRWQTGGGSFSHTSIDILKPQASLVECSTSGPTLWPGSPEPSLNLSQYLVHASSGGKLKSLKRLSSNQ